MRVLLITLAALVVASPSYGQVNPQAHWVDGHYRTDGSWVEGYWATNPNSTNRDNYSTYPNVNPWTGEQGTVQPDGNVQEPQPFAPGQVRETRTAAGDPLFMATSPMPPISNYEGRPLSPEERAARRAETDRRLAEDRMRQRIADDENKAYWEARRNEKEAKRAARKAAKERTQ